MSDPGLQDTQQNIRIPLVNVGDSRLSGGETGSYWDQLYLNCFPLVAAHPVTGETDLSVTKRPGIFCSGSNIKSALTTSGGPTCPMANIGITQLSDVCVVAMFEVTTSIIKIIQYRPSANTVTLLGTISGCTVYDKVYFTEVMLTTTEFAGLAITWCRGDYLTSKGYFCQSNGVQFAGGSLTQITSATFAANISGEVLVGPIQQLNSYFYAMTRSGKIYQCDNAYNIVAWGGARIIETYSYPDKAVGIFRFKHHLVGFSDTTIEFFNDSGARGDGSTISNNLERTEQAFIKFGAISAKYVKNIDDVLYWASSSDTTTTGIWRMDGYTPIKISTYKQDQILNSSYILTQNATTISGSLESLSILGQKHIIINAVYATIIPFAQTTSTEYPRVDDPFDKVFDDSSKSKLRPNVICYCLDTKCWWHLSDCSDDASYGYLPCSYFNRNAGDNYSSEYIFKVCSVSQDVFIPNVNTSSSFIFSLNTAQGFSFIDFNIDGVYRPRCTVVSCIQTNTLDQGTSLYKYLKKLVLTMDTPGQFEQDDQMESYIYISMERNDSQGMGVASNQRIYPIKQRNLNKYAQSMDILTYSYNQTFAQPTTTMTVEGWFKGDFTFINSSNIAPIFSWKSDNTNSSWYLAFNQNYPTSWAVVFDIANTATEVPGVHAGVYVGPPSGPFYTEWAHFAFVCDLSQVGAGNKLKLYINGVLTPFNGGNTITATSFLTSSDGLTIGARQAGNPFAYNPLSTSGVQTSNVRVWNTARTQEQINFYMNDQTLVSGVDAGLIWNMLDGTSTAIYDNQTPPNQRVFMGVRDNVEISRPIFTKTYHNNCGLVDRTAFCILNKSPLSFRAKSLDLTMAQGTR